jgi:hypothetical protein
MGEEDRLDSILRNAVLAKCTHLICLASLALWTSSCGNPSGADIVTFPGMCDNYPDPKSSKYILPYAFYESHLISQANCGSASHYGSSRYSYDIQMNIGTRIHAARSGTVISIEEGFANGNGCPKGNHVYVKHADGTVAVYYHLTTGGALVDVGKFVHQGDAIALSGNTGCSTGPHLHFSLFTDDSLRETTQVTFRNTADHPIGLEPNTQYRAEWSWVNDD